MPLLRRLLSALLLMALIAVPSPAAASSGAEATRPAITDGGPAPAPPSRAWLVGDPDTGEVFAGSDLATGHAPASVLKLLTALALAPVLDDREQVITADEAAASIDGTKVGLVDGGEYTVDQLFHALLMFSGNDAAYALAEATGGQEEAAAILNATAARIGLRDTRAVNTSGLDAEGQVMSARDALVLAHHVAEDEYLMDIIGTETYDWPSATDTSGRRWDGYQIQNRTRVVGEVDGALGLKNGYTEAAGGSFVALAERDDERIVSVLLGTETGTRDWATDLLEWGFVQSELLVVETIPLEPEPTANAGGSEVSTPAASQGVGGGTDPGDRRVLLIGVACLLVLVGLFGIGIGRSLRGSRRPRRNRR